MNDVRVVVTGIGVISPIGNTKDEFWQSLQEGKSGIGPITHFDASLHDAKIAGEIKGFDPLLYLDKKEAKRMDHFAQYAVAAAKMALKDADFEINEENCDDIGVYVASGIGGLETLEAQHKVLLEKGPKRISPFVIPMMIVNMASGQVSIVTGAKGPNTTVVTACASSTNSIGDAYKLIQRGAAKAMIAGGTEATITPLAVAGFASMKALSTRNDEPERASRPFDAERDGFIMAEGSCMVILETLESALERGAHIYAEVVGYGATADAYHITSPAPDAMGAVKCMKVALKDAGLEPQDIDYINAHGTSTHMNDSLETLAIKKTFGEHAEKLNISSTKSMTGHMLGAAGAIEFATICLSVDNDIIPPTINYENPDPECDLNYTPNKMVKKTVNAALSNSLGFGGHNATLIVKKYKD